MEDGRVAKDDTNKKKSESSGFNQDSDPAHRNHFNPLKSVKCGNVEDESSKPSAWKPESSNTKNDELEQAKVEMGGVMEENKRLKSDLDRMMKDYQALQTRFHEIATHEPKSPLDDVGNTSIVNNQMVPRKLEDDTHELSLSLGRNNSSLDSKNKNNNHQEVRPLETLKESSGLSLALDYKREGGSKTSTEQGAPMQNSSTGGTDNSFDEPKDEAGETWPPSKALKTIRSGGGGGRDDEVVQQPPVKKARVSVRARCDTPTMNDGCQWRKYGQKIAKGNPCPRAYYRCTVASSCPVRKQVQRCSDDMSILITTYEGTHNHPLPISATAMASTTSAAAYMLISGSSTTTTTTSANNFPSNSVSNYLPGLNFNFSDTSRSRPIFLPHSSFSPSPSQPTITLDLTTSSTSSTSASQFSKLAPTSFAPRSYPTTTNLTFNSLDLSNPNPSGSTLPISWPPNGQLSYPTATNPTPRTHGPMSSLSRDQDTFYQNLLQKINPNPNHVPTPNSSNKQPQQPSLDTVAEAARAITSDPSFQSVLTAALSSLMAGNSNTNGTSTGIVDAGVKASRFLSIVPNNGTPNSEAGNLMVLSSQLPFSASSKSNSTSPGVSRDQTN